MSPKEKDAIARILSALSSRDSMADAIVDVLEGLRLIADADIATLIDHKQIFQDKKFSEVAIGDQSQIAVLKRFHPQYHHVNPMNAFVVEWMKKDLATLRKLHVLDMPGFIGRAKWFASPFYRDCMRHCGMNEMLGLCLEDPNGLPRRGVSLSRECASQGKQSWRKRLPQIQWLLPYITRGLINLELWASEKQTWELLAADNPVPVLLALKSSIGQTCRLVHLNKAAESVLGVHKQPLAANLHLQELLRLCAGVNTAWPSAGLPWQASDGGCYRVVLRQADNNSEGLVIKLIKAASQAGASPGEAWRLLNAREQRIFVLLEQGLSNKEIAHALHRSVDTIHSHVLKLYRKLGVHGRVEAIWRVRQDNPQP
jgi:DNA-binding CsgD family transcriptional regulator